MYSFPNPQENPTKIHNITDYNQHLLMATWPSCTVHMLERNRVVVVVDQGPAARWRKTRREKFECAPAYDIALTMKKNKITTKQNNWKNILPKLWRRQLVFLFFKCGERKDCRFAPTSTSWPSGNAHRYTWLCITESGKEVQFYENCCKSGGFLTIDDPLWSCAMLLCGPLRYLVIRVRTPLVAGSG